MRLLQKISRAFEALQAQYYRCFGYDYPCDCGHYAKWKTFLVIYGEENIVTLPGKAPKCCPKCWARKAIQCAWCGGGIVPNQGITLYAPEDELKIPDHAVVYRDRRKKQKCLVGCLRETCTRNALFDQAGFWVMPGEVMLAINPIEQAFMKRRSLNID